MNRTFFWIFVAIALLPLQGCLGLGYYAETANGHLELLAAREPVDEIRVDPSRPLSQRTKMDKAAEMRQFAVDVLKLPDNASYKSYVDLERGYVTVAVFAASEFSLEPATWCFPIFGCVPYRAFFWEDNARELAHTLREKGLDVYVTGVTAYSTLGWTPDPLLNTMLDYGDTHLAAVMFHELAHQRVYVRNDSAFNEAFAVAVEIEGVKKWFRAKGDAKRLTEYEQSRERQREFLALVENTRQTLLGIYAGSARDASKREAKDKAIEAMKARYVKMRNGKWGGYDGYDGWFSRPINNAQLAASGIYNDLVPDFQRLFQSCGEDFARFYSAAGKLAKRSPDERRLALKQTNCT
ncbi:MAG: aminopeptidase [Pseudomonadota bacterium]